MYRMHQPCLTVYSVNMLMLCHHDYYSENKTRLTLPALMMVHIGWLERAAISRRLDL